MRARVRAQDVGQHLPAGGSMAGRGLVPLAVLALALSACAGAPGQASPSFAVGSPKPAQSLGPAPSPTSLPEGVLASIPLSSGGVDGTSVAAVGFGAVWVESHRGTTLYRVDPATDQIVARIDVGQGSCGEPAIGFGRIWLGECDSSTKTIVVDGTTNEVVGSFDALGGSIAFTDDAVWIPDLNGKLMKVDPTSYRTLATYDPFPSGFTGWVVGAGGSIWVADESWTNGVWGGSLAQVDPATGAIVSHLTVPDPGLYAAVTADLGYIWIKGDADGRLIRVDPKTGAIKTFNLPGFAGLTQLYDIYPATGLGSVWVRLADETVTRVDPDTGKVTGTYPAEPYGGGGWPTVGFGSLWIPNFASGTLWRDRVAP